jgi:hypothetical protein
MMARIWHGYPKLEHGATAGANTGINQLLQ